LIDLCEVFLIYRILPFRCLKTAMMTCVVRSYYFVLLLKFISLNHFTTTTMQWSNML